MDLILLEGDTGDIIFGKLEELFKKHGLSLEKVNLIVTDPAPAMVGNKKMLHPKLMHYTVSITKGKLCAKMSGALKELMHKTMKGIQVCSIACSANLHWNLKLLMITSYSTMTCTC